ncbi:hypothetical protein [Bradyrhizobium liaoningense]|uniref:hypothetical protein n=1 Tax=Bradyrhizobium liaoningense TaxID=43992 RepID=UPI001BAB95BD|nr:hypothetical protein [Bradyrhizobium liaoningense]MBR0941574.1 hypothetical protein [Bradyrhizobium liaoningense]
MHGGFIVGNVRLILSACMAMLLAANCCWAASQIDQSTLNGFIYKSDLSESSRAALSAHLPLIFTDVEPNGLGRKTYEVIGGVLVKGVLGEVVRPNKANSKIDIGGIRYDQSRQDGDRVAIDISGAIIRPKIFDWLWLPMIQFVDSPANAAVTLFALYDVDAKSRAEFLREATMACQCRKPYFVGLHPALIDTRLGMLLLYSDIIPINSRFRQPPTVSGVRLVPNAKTFDEELSRKSYDELQGIIRQEPFQSYIMADNDVRYSASITDKILIAGEPRYSFWHYDQARNIELNLKTNADLKARQEQGLLRDINEDVYGTLELFAKWTSLLRRFKMSDPAGWQALKDSASKTAVEHDVETPVIYGPGRR